MSQTLLTKQNCYIQKLTRILLKKKEELITGIYKDRDKPTLFTPKQKVYIKKHVRQKLDLVRKTVATTSQPKVHMDNLRRPLRNKYSFDT